MLALDLILRWIHILSAVVLVGGTVFQRFAWAPAMAGQANGSLSAEVRARWSKWVMAASGLLLISGLINIWRVLQEYEIADADFPGSAYHMIFGIKFLLALAVFFLASVLSGRSALAERFRKKENLWLSVNVLLAVIVVCLAGIMKMADRRPRPATAARPAVPWVAWNDTR